MSITIPDRKLPSPRSRCKFLTVDSPFARRWIAARYWFDYQPPEPYGHGTWHVYPQPGTPPLPNHFNASCRYKTALRARLFALLRDAIVDDYHRHLNRGPQQTLFSRHDVFAC
jgi:hypothetical protein